MNFGNGYDDSFGGNQGQEDQFPNNQFDFNNNNNLSDDNGEIKFIPGKKKILNNPNLNENIEIQNDNNPESSFHYNENANITEEVSNKTVGVVNKFLDRLGKYFNVELSDLKSKLKGAIIPLNKSFYQSIEVNSDLYGPFWTFTTIIFLLAVVGNFSSYTALEDKTKYYYNFNFVPHAALIIYGFGFGAPIAVWLVSKFMFKIDINLLTNMCVYGYSYVVLIPVLLICIVPIGLIQTLALIYFLAHSCTFLFYNMYLIIQQKAPKSKFIVLGILGGIQFILFLTLKFYFFKKIVEKK